MVRAGSGSWPGLPPHFLTDLFFQEGLGTVELKGDRVCTELSIGVVNLFFLVCYVD